jgi:glutathione S-transferase
MVMELFAHPFSSYCWKVLIALWENDIPFTYRNVDPAYPENGAELARLWPLVKFPVLVDDGQIVAESSIIIEHLQLRHPGPVRLIPDDPAAALEVRMLDRVFDNHVMGQMQRIVNDRLRAAEARCPDERVQAAAALDKIYAWLNQCMNGRDWAAGGTFSMADCAAAPSLFYADWVHPITERLANLRAYRARLLARPSVARAVEEARPYRSYFPGGAPERD